VQAASVRPRSRRQAVEVVAGQLLPRASLITRLLLRAGEAGLSRAEVGVLSGLEAGALRITELATAQAFAQPTVTQIVALLTERGYVERGRHPGDGRVVLVSLTHAGREALDAVRGQYRALLRAQLADRSDEEVLALAEAVDVLQEVIDALRVEATP
jgi:DNA-binding MarR family transcriptional regulator